MTLRRIKLGSIFKLPIESIWLSVLKIKLSGVQPTKVWRKGEYINQKTKRRYEENGFTYEPNPEMADEIEDKLEKLLAGLQTLKSNLLNPSMQTNVHIQINIAFYGYKDQMSGWHLNPKTLKAIAKLNASIDFDLYASGPDLPQDF
jgi:hypothetical protein